MKKFLLFLLIVVAITFIYLKVQVAGDPNSNFNQTTRYSLGKYGIVRTILGLHNAGDARAELLQKNLAPIVVEWFSPSGQDIDKALIDQFTRDLGAYTGRPAQAVYGGGIDDATLDVNTLGVFELKANTQKPVGATVIPVFFTEDYTPRGANELVASYKEWGIIISLSAHKNFFNTDQNSTPNLLSSLLKGFGYQIGLPNSSDPGCVMNSHTSSDGQPLKYFGSSLPGDFCPAEQSAINNLKLQFGQ